MREENQIVICAIAKMEYGFIYDWVAWHLRLGFDKIYIYDNNDPEGERYDELLSKFIKEERCELIDCRGEQGVQIEKYNEFYKAGRFKWCAFIDIDEFFYFKPTGKYNNIKDFLKMKKNADAYMLLWECYGSAGLKKDGHIWDNCKKLPYNVRKSTDSYLNFWHKSIVRSGLDITINEHTICEGFYNYNIYNERGERITSQMSLFSYQYDHNNTNLCINHYLLRDIDTFFYKKYLRGHAGFVSSGGWDGWTPDAWNQNINYFIDTQRFISKDEQEYLYSKGMRPNWIFHPTILIIIYALPGNSEYFKGIMNKLKDIRMNSDCMMTISLDSTILDDEGNNADYNIKKYNFEYIYNYDISYSCMMWDSPGRIDLSKYDNYYIQQPLILHIGSPLDMYTEIPVEFFDNILQYAKSLCFYNQNDNILFTPSSLVENDLSDNLFIEDNLKTGMKLYHKRFKNNIFLTTFTTYNRIVEFYRGFDQKIYNDDIVNNNAARYSTYYNKFNFLWPGLVKNIIEV